MRALIIDDSKTARAVLRKILAQIGNTDVVEAANGNEALASVSQELPDLILCDWKMPEMDGMAFVKALQETRFSDIPVIMVSSESYLNRILDVMQAGAQGYIRKPFTASALQAKIREVLTRSNLARNQQRTASSFAGSVDEIGFPGLVQFVASSQLTGCLVIEGATTGTIEFCDGDIRAAQHRGFDGDAAFYSLADVEAGQFRFTRSEGGVDGNISSGTMALLMEAMRRRDERESVSQQKSASPE